MNLFNENESIFSKSENNLENKLHLIALQLRGLTYDEKLQDKINITQMSLIETARYLLKSDLYEWLEAAEESIKSHERINAKIITLLDKNYPLKIKSIDQVPFALFVLGPLKSLNSNTFSIVGTRKPSLITSKWVEKITEKLSTEYTIVSGMAKGVDRICQRMAVQLNKSTIGIIAHGLDYTYPADNHDLFSLARKLENENLTLISEYNLGTKPKRYHFPRRNRLIAGMSDYLLMAEGGIKSGALITVNDALKQGRSVFVLNHDSMTNNEGGRKLLEQGAMLFNSFLDISVNKFESSEGLIERTMDKNQFYLGRQTWAQFRS